MLLIHTLSFITPDISYTELAAGVAEQKFTLVDIRKPTELEEVGKLPGAHCLPG